VKWLLQDNGLAARFGRVKSNDRATIFSPIQRDGFLTAAGRLLMKK
jgi:hypothetical protein